MNNNEFSLWKDQKCHRILADIHLVRCHPTLPAQYNCTSRFSLLESISLRFWLNSTGTCISLIPEHSLKTPRYSTRADPPLNFLLINLFCSKFACKYKHMSKEPITKRDFPHMTISRGSARSKKVRGNF